jgi:membrane associated rhomboid family serine protease
MARVADTCYPLSMSTLGGADGDPNRFGTVAFYATLGRAFVIMCGVIPFLFAIELVDRGTGHQLDAAAGIRPHQLDGLDGVLFAPLLHANFNHLYGNSVPLLLTGTFVLATGGKRFLGVTAVVALCSGLGVWLTGDPHSVVIGASGVIFGYLGFLFVRGIVERSWWGIGVGLLIGLLYGTQLANVLPSDPRLSWQAHLFGLLGGVVAAILFRRRRPGPPVPGTARDFTTGGGRIPGPTDPTLDLPPG